MNQTNFLNNPDDNNKSCFSSVLYLLTAPLGIYLFILAGYAGFIPFKVEIHSVVLIGIIFVIYIFLLKHNAFFASCKFSQSLESFKSELETYIKKNLLTIASTTKANASYGDFAKNFTAGLRNENFASIAAGIFPTLGILGTFISIAISMPDFSSKTSAVLEREISLLLGGVGTAFYVSIYGIFLSIWWIFFDKTGLSKFEKIVNNIKIQTKSLFWEKEEIEQTYFQKSMENFEKLNQVFNNFAQDELIENMNKTMTQRVKMFDEIITQEQNTIKNTTSLMNESLKLTGQSQEINNKIISDFKDMISAYKESSQQIEQSTKYLQEITQALKSKESSITQIATSLEGISSQNIEQIHQAIVKNFEIMKKDTDQIGWAFNSYLNEFDEKFSDRLKETLLTIDSEVAKIVNSLEQVKELENVPR
jgi:hypothetical protein